MLASPHGGNPYRLFPSKPTSVHCRIPAGGIKETLLPGTCTTLVAVSENGSAVVRFVMTWGSGIASHTWAFSVSKSGRVIGRREYGQPPPLYAE